MSSGPDWRQTNWPDWIQRPPLILESVDSTNTYVKHLASEQQAPEGTLVIAETQTAGRGRQGRSWFSPSGRSIYASWLLRPDFSPRYAQIPTLLASAAAAAAIQHLYSLPARVKWPNDVLIEDRKIGGILTESAVAGERIAFLLVGLGLNCNVESELWPAELRKTATSIQECLGRTVDRTELLSLILRIFGEDYHRLKQGRHEEALRGWRALNVTLGQQTCLRMPHREIRGFAEALLPDGGLRLREALTGASVDVRAGEIY